MALPASREQLKEYALRRLGKPVIEINIDEEQMQDRLDEAFMKFQKYHGESVTRTIVKHQLTDSDLSNGYIEVPNTIAYIKNILAVPTSSSSSLFNVEYQYMLHNVHDMTSGGISDYYMTQRHVSLLNFLFQERKDFIYSKYKNRITFNNDDGSLISGEYLIFEGYGIVDPDTFTDVYGDEWLLEYVTALFKLQWGNNMKKYDGVQLPGGITLNGSQIYQEALDEVQRLEEELENKYQEPVNFFIG